MNPQAYESWNVLNIRCSVFWPATLQRRPNHNFQAMFDLDPQDQSNNIAQQLFLENGQLLGNPVTDPAISVRLGMNPTRSDIVFMVMPTTEEGTAGINARVFLTPATTHIRRFFDFFENVSRVAYAIALVRPSEPNKTAMAQACEMLPHLRGNFNAASNFEYKLERSHVHDIAGAPLKFNTVTHWSTANFIAVTAPAGQPILMANIASMLGQGKTSLALEVEVNTDGDRVDILGPAALAESLIAIHSSVEHIVSAKTFNPQ